jgi:hypothetical protein
LSFPLAGFASRRHEYAGVADGVVTGAGSGKRCYVGARPEGCGSSCHRVALLEGKLAKALRA